MKSLSIRSTVYPFDYNRNNPKEGFNSWSRYIRIELNKMQGLDKAQLYLRNRKLIDAAVANHENGSLEMSELIHEAQQLLKNGIR